MSFVQLITSCCFVLGCMLMAVSADASELNWNIVKKLEQNQKAYNALIAKAEKNQIGYSVLLDEVRRLKKERYGYISEAKKARRALRQKHREEKKLTTDERKFYVEINEQINKPTKTTISKSKAVAAHSKGQLKSINAKDKKDYYARNPGIEKRSNPKGVVENSGRLPSSKNETTSSSQSKQQKQAPKTYTYKGAKSNTSADIRQFTKASYRPTYVKTETRVEHKVVENQKAYAASTAKFPTSAQNIVSPLGNSRSTVKFTNNKEVVTGKLPTQQPASRFDDYSGYDSLPEDDMNEIGTGQEPIRTRNIANDEPASRTEVAYYLQERSEGLKLSPSEIYDMGEADLTSYNMPYYGEVSYGDYSQSVAAKQNPQYLKQYNDAILRKGGNGRRSLQVVKDEHSFTTDGHTSCDAFEPDRRFDMEPTQKVVNGIPQYDMYGQKIMQTNNLPKVARERFKRMLSEADIKKRYEHFNASFSYNMVLEHSKVPGIPDKSKDISENERLVHIAMFEKFTNYFDKVTKKANGEPKVPILRGIELTAESKKDARCASGKNLADYRKHGCNLALHFKFDDDGIWGEDDKKACEERRKKGEDEPDIFVFDVEPKEGGKEDHWYVVDLLTPVGKEPTGLNATSVLESTNEEVIQDHIMAQSMARAATGFIYYGALNEEITRNISFAQLGKEYRELYLDGIKQRALQNVASTDTEAAE